LIRHPDEIVGMVTLHALRVKLDAGPGHRACGFDTLVHLATRPKGPSRFQFEFPGGRITDGRITVDFNDASGYNACHD
jgi:hypothetical protein